jgi:hypothetical protein
MSFKNPIWATKMDGKYWYQNGHRKCARKADAFHRATPLPVANKTNMSNPLRTSHSVVITVDLLSLHSMCDFPACVFCSRSSVELVIRTRVSNPSVPQRNDGIRQNPYARIPSRTGQLGAIERHTTLDSTDEQEGVENSSLLNERPSPLIEVVEVVLHGLRECRSRRVKLHGRRLRTRERLRGKRWVQQEGLCCHTRDEDLDENANRGLEVRVFQGGDVKELHEEEVEDATL